MILLKRYSPEMKETWNRFNAQSRQSIFMYDRGYMDYHKDRFKDHSLLFYDDEKLIAIIPISEHEDALISHGGLTFGGFVTGPSLKQILMIKCFEEMIKYAKQNKFKSIYYKCVPSFYCNQQSEEDRYGLFVYGANIVTVDVSTVIKLNDQIKESSLRKRTIKKAQKKGIRVIEGDSIDEYECYIKIISQILKKKYKTEPTHTAKEIKLLHDSFPDNIHLIYASLNNVMIAGSIVYEYENVIHTQYLGANEEGKATGALDLVINYIIEKYNSTKGWLDFGISTEHGRKYLNEGLVSYKEGFGGRTAIYETWKIEL